VHARLPARRIPAVFAMYLDQVYAAARDGLIHIDGQNIFVYRKPDQSDDLDVDFGVGATRPFTAAGSVQYSELPVGEVATTTHWGDYSQLGAAHAAVIAWCRANRRELAGTSWEVYGHWSDDPARRRTDVFYLLRV
jgi:effector-binding domain-containing protein